MLDIVVGNGSLNLSLSPNWYAASLPPVYSLRLPPYFSVHRIQLCGLLAVASHAWNVFLRCALV
jgi:hypothetical protein